MTSRAPLIPLLGATVLALGGCGGTSDGADPREPRPPASADLSAQISDDGVRISPTRIGGGPVRLVISNSTSKTLRPSIVRTGGRGRVPTIRPVPPGGVAAITAEVARGTWSVRAGHGIPPATLRVGRARRSADSTLLLP